MTNVLLITCDALRADHVGVLGGGRPSLTPRLDALAAEGVAFRHAVSQGFRTPISMPSLFTGLYPSRMGWFTIPSPFALRRQVTGVLLGEGPTLAERLAGLGYRTAGIHSNPLLSRLFGYGRGFELFDDDLFLADRALPAWLQRWAYRVPQLFRVSGHLAARAVNDKAMRWLAARPSPFFLWLHYMDTHGPYCSRPELSYVRRLRAQLLYQKAVSRPAAVTAAERAQLIEDYRGQVTYMDDQIGALLDGLAATGRLDDTLVVLTADHGEEFGEHGRYSHHSTLFETLLRVPLLLRLPGARHAGRVIDTPVALLQVLPTVLDVVGAPVPDGLDGTSLLPLMDGSAATGLDWIVSEAKAFPGDKAAIRSGPWKLIVDRRRAERTLYQVERDPDERTDALAEAPAIAQRWEAQLDAMMPVLAGGVAAQTGRDVDAATAERLRDLGYL
jgi:arylsulfatase A-like enzyme